MASMASEVNFEIDTVEFEELAELFDECVPRLDQDPDQRIAIERADRGDHWQPTDEFRNQAELDEGPPAAHANGSSDSGLRSALSLLKLRAVAYQPLRDDVISPAKAPPTMNSTLVVSIWMKS